MHLIHLICASHFLSEIKYSNPISLILSSEISSKISGLSIDSNTNYPGEWFSFIRLYSEHFPCFFRALEYVRLRQVLDEMSLSQKWYLVSPFGLSTLRFKTVSSESFSSFSVFVICSAIKWSPLIFPSASRISANSFSSSILASMS